MPPISRAVVEALIKQHRVVVFSKTWCPYCNKVKQTLNNKSIDFHKVELDKGLCYKIKHYTIKLNSIQLLRLLSLLYNMKQHPEGEIYQSVLEELSGQKTVPNVYINGNHVGGASDTIKLDEEGKLISLVKM